MDNVKNNIHYSKLKLKNKTEKLEKSKGKNGRIKKFNYSVFHYRVNFSIIV